MMDPERDIYSNKKAPPPPEKVDYPQVDVSPHKLLSEARRRVLFSSVFILMFLGLAILLFLYLEERSHRDDLEDATEAELAAVRQPRSIDRREDFGVPEIPSQFDSLREEPPPDLDPRRVTEAMGYVRIARQYAGEQEWDLAIINAQRALSIWENMTAAYSLLGFIYTQRGEFEQALAVLNRAIKQDPFNPEIYNTIAAIHMQRGEWNEAEELLNTAIELVPEYMHAYINLGMLYLLMGEFEWAAENFEIVLEQMPGHAAIRNNLAVCFVRMGRFQEAQSQFQYLIDQQPDQPSYYFNMAISYTEQGDMGSAMEWIRQAATLCTPMEFQQFMEDSDFDELRQLPQYREFVESTFPQVHSPIQF